MMRYKGYLGKVEFDSEAKTLQGEVVGIRDVVTFQGQSVREVERAFRESVDDYLKFCAARDEEPNQPASGQFVMRIEPELHRKATMLAAASGKSLNAWVRDCLDHAVADTLPVERSGSIKPSTQRSPKRRKAS